jgi:hypothetical protein
LARAELLLTMGKFLTKQELDTFQQAAGTSVEWFRSATVWAARTTVPGRRPTREAWSAVDEAALLRLAKRTKQGCFVYGGGPDAGESAVG